MVDSPPPHKPEEILSYDEFVRAIAQTIADKLDLPTSQSTQDSEVLANTTYPRHDKLVSIRQRFSGLVFVLLLYSMIDSFYPVFQGFEQPKLGIVISFLSILSGLTLILLLVFEVFLGAGLDVEIEVKQGQNILQKYHFIPSLNRLPFLLAFLGLGFFTIILGFASLYAELLRQNASNFSGLEEGFLSIYFSIVTFSTVGYGDIYPVSLAARASAICEIFIAMFFSLVALSTTLSWVTAYERQQHDFAIGERIKEIRKQEREKQ